MNKSACGGRASASLPLSFLLLCAGAVNPLAQRSAFAQTTPVAAVATSAPAVPVRAVNSAHELEEAFEHVADIVAPATVQITVNIESHPDLSVLPGWEAPSFFGDSPRAGQRIVERDFGSGVIFRPDGYILTNDHVVEKAMGAKVLVTLSDKRTFWGKVVRDSASDLAVVKINAGRPLPYVTLGAAKPPRVGQWAIAIGSPLNEQNIVTAGIVSAIHRDQQIGSDDGSSNRYYADLIETDAPINFGNSGGPLVNIDGELIGINVAMTSRGSVGTALGFAIPANIAKAISDQLIANGKVMRSTLGIVPSGIPSFLRKASGAEKGAYVTKVDLNTPADRAGIQPGDIITHFGANDIEDASALRFAINMTPPHVSVPIILVRAGRSQTVTASLDRREEESDGSLLAPSIPIVNLISKLKAEDLGLNVHDLSAAYSALRDIHPALRGVLVGSVSRGSLSDDAGVARNSVITSVNGNPITSVESLNAILAALKPGDVVGITLYVPGYENQAPSRGVANIELP